MIDEIFLVFDGTQILGVCVRLFYVSICGATQLTKNRRHSLEASKRHACVCVCVCVYMCFFSLEGKTTNVRIANRYDTVRW